VVGGDGQRGVVAQQADDIQVGQPRLDHHDVRTLSLIKNGLAQRLHSQKVGQGGAGGVVDGCGAGNQLGIG
jgi:hypothetical protein